MNLVRRINYQIEFRTIFELVRFIANPNYVNNLNNGTNVVAYLIAVNCTKER